MGHIRLGSLPQTRNLQQVIGQLRQTDDPAVIATATCKAAERGLDLAAKDPGVHDAVHLLMQTFLCARREDFANSLSQIGIDLPESSRGDSQLRCAF